MAKAYIFTDLFDEQFSIPWLIALMNSCLVEIRLFIPILG